MMRLVLTLVAGVMLVACAVPPLTGADEDQPTDPPARRQRGEGERPPPPEGRRPPPPPPHPLELALDANDDGEISAEEIAGAVEALKKADRNGDGKLTGNEMRPPPPPHAPPPRGAGGGRGDRRPPGPPPGEEGDDRPPPRRRNAPPRDSE